MSVPTLIGYARHRGAPVVKSVVILNDTAHVDGGASKVAIDSAVGLARRGIDVTFVAAAGPVAPQLEGAVHVQCTGQAKITDSRSRLAAAAQGLWNSTAGETVRKTLADLVPGETVVHVHSWTKALSASALRAIANTGLSTVVTLHEFFSACPAGSFYDHPKEQICSRRAMSPACIAANCDSRSYPTKLYRVARQFALNGFARFPETVPNYITMSDLSRSVLAPYLPKGARLYRTRNPIDAVMGSPVAVAANDSVAYVGRLSPEKGVVMLAETATRIGAKLTFVGDGEERNRIEAIAPGARITGWLNADGVRAELRRARALILPSLWYEVMPLVVMEAAALGVPSIVPDTCGAVEEVEHERTGLIFRGASAEALAESIARLGDDRLVASLGSAAHDRYWSRPASLDSHLDDLLDIYERILAQRPRS